MTKKPSYASIALMELTIACVHGSWGLYYRGQVIGFYDSEAAANNEKTFLLDALLDDSADDGPEVDIIRRELAIRDYEKQQLEGTDRV